MRARMKKLFFLFLVGLFILIPRICKADWQPFETIDESQVRSEHNEYQQRQNNPYGEEPLGGYQQTLSGSSVFPYSDQSNNQPAVYEPKPLEITDNRSSRHEAEHYEERQSNPYNMQWK